MSRSYFKVISWVSFAGYAACVLWYSLHVAPALNAAVKEFGVMLGMGARISFKCAQFAPAILLCVGGGIALAMKTLEDKTLEILLPIITLACWVAFAVLGYYPLYQFFIQPLPDLGGLP